MKKKEPRKNIFRAIRLSLNDNRLSLKFFLLAQQSITVYFYGSVCVTHTLLCVSLCVCVSVCVANIYTKCHISMVVKTHELPVL